MTKVYSIDVELAATLYVKAEDEEAAKAKIAEFIDGIVDDVRDTVSDADYSDDDLPEVSLAPAMTPKRVYNWATLGIAEDLGDEDGDLVDDGVEGADSP